MTDDAAKLYYLDDLRLGQVFQSGVHRVGAEEIKAFARQFDPQPFHLDEGLAKDTFFGGLAASGWHVAAITMKLLTDGAAPLAGGVIGGGGEIAWPNPTRPGDVLQVTSEVVAITPSRSKPDRGMISLRSETRNQDGRIAQVFTAKLIVPKRAGTA
jgi:acyl dehydratase